MLHAEETRARLLHVLTRAKLVDPQSYDEARARVRARARAEHARVAGRIGYDLWSSGIDELGPEDGDRGVARVLGFGYELTHLFVSPLALPPDTREAVAHAGALANCIVSIYDRCLDRGADGDIVLSRDALRDLSMQSAENAVPRHGAAGLVRQLVALYFEDLAKLAANTDHASIRYSITDAIVRMYDAERQTAHRATVTPRALRQKNGLPFVVMGLPGWLVTDLIRPRQMRSHIAWLYRCGLFVGLIDDIVDVERDRRAGHPNQLDALSLSPSDAAQHVERLGRRLQRDWQQLAPHADRSALQAALGTCLLSWLGGQRSLDPRRLTLREAAIHSRP